MLVINVLKRVVKWVDPILAKDMVIRVEDNAIRACSVSTQSHCHLNCEINEVNFVIVYTKKGRKRNLKSVEGQFLHEFVMTSSSHRQDDDSVVDPNNLHLSTH